MFSHITCSHLVIDNPTTSSKIRDPVNYFVIELYRLNFYFSHSYNVDDVVNFEYPTLECNICCDWDSMFPMVVVNNNNNNNNNNYNNNNNNKNNNDNDNDK